MLAKNIADLSHSSTQCEVLRDNSLSGSCWHFGSKKDEDAVPFDNPAAKTKEKTQAGVRKQHPKTPKSFKNLVPSNFVDCFQDIVVGLVRFSQANFVGERKRMLLASAAHLFPCQQQDQEHSSLSTTDTTISCFRHTIQP